MIKAVVVGDAGERGCVRRQRNGSEGPAIVDESAREFRRQMLTVSSRSPVAAEHDLLAAIEGCHQQRDRRFNGRKNAFEAAEQLAVFFELVFEEIPAQGLARNVATWFSNARKPGATP